MTAHDELREAVARAIAVTISGQDAEPILALDYAVADAALAAVRAALEVPDEAMCWAGWRVGGKSFAAGQEPMVAPRIVFLAMLHHSPLADPGARDDGAGVG